MSASLPIADSMVRRYVRTGVVVDTELLVLLAVGRYDETYIPAFKRTAGFTSEDYEILSGFLARFRSLVLSPQVLAELSNYSYQIPEARLSVFLNTLIELVSRMTEVHVPKDEIITHGSFRKVGATDAGLIICCTEGSYLLLSKDRRLCGLARQVGVDALHFDELRGYVWFSDH